MDPINISKLITEDITVNNGLILENMSLEDELDYYFGGKWSINNDKIEGHKLMVVSGGYDDYGGGDVRAEVEYDPEIHRTDRINNNSAVVQRTFSVIRLDPATGTFVDEVGKYTNKLNGLPKLRGRLIQKMQSEIQRNPPRSWFQQQLEQQQLEQQEKSKQKEDQYDDHKHPYW